VAFRGCQPARIDEKGRLKIPSEYRAQLEERYGTRLFVTSQTGASVLVYPMPEWEAIEARLAQMPSTHPARIKFLDIVSYYGQTVELDAQGRLLVPQRIREKAEIAGEVDVVGSLTRLEIWNHERFRARAEDAPLTDEDRAALSAFGI
jgi:MraZ protein